MFSTSLLPEGRPLISDHFGGRACARYFLEITCQCKEDFRTWTHFHTYETEAMDTAHKHYKYTVSSRSELALSDRDQVYLRLARGQSTATSQANVVAHQCLWAWVHKKQKNSLTSSANAVHG